MAELLDRDPLFDRADNAGSIVLEVAVGGINLADGNAHVLWRSCTILVLKSIPVRDLVRQRRLRYIQLAHPAEGSHNGSAAVLKTAGRKAMQVRVLSPPPFALKLELS